MGWHDKVLSLMIVFSVGLITAGSCLSLLGAAENNAWIQSDTEVAFLGIKFAILLAVLPTLYAGSARGRNLNFRVWASHYFPVLIWSAFLIFILKDVRALYGLAGVASIGIGFLIMTPTGIYILMRNFSRPSETLRQELELARKKMSDRSAPLQSVPRPSGSGPQAPETCEPAP